MGRKAKAPKIRRNVRSMAHPGEDATPERLAKSDCAEWVNPALIDSSEQPISRTRQFSDAWIDRMLRRGQITYAQWFACDWYRSMHADAFTAQRVVADYGQGAGGAGTGNYGQAASILQQQKRKTFREARSRIQENMLSPVEAIVLQDQMPPFANGRQRSRFIARFATAVQPLAEHICAPGWWL